MTEEMISRVKGMIAALVSRGQFPKREPVAFLYGHVAKEGETPTHTINGVEYVGEILPEVQKTHAYVYIGTLDVLGNTYCAWYASEYPFYMDSVGCTTEGYGSILSGAVRTPIHAGSEWDCTDISWDANNHGGLPIWANHDILSEDGAVYLAASDPIPVYE